MAVTDRVRLPARSGYGLSHRHADSTPTLLPHTAISELLLCLYAITFFKSALVLSWFTNKEINEKECSFLLLELTLLSAFPLYG